MDHKPNIAREVNAHILALEALIREKGFRSREPDQDLIGLFCECGCMKQVTVSRDDYEEQGGVWLEGHRPTRPPETSD